MGLQQDTAEPLLLTEAEYKAAKSKCTKLLVSGDETLHYTKEQFAGTRYGLALFDTNGTLMRLYGDALFFALIADLGILQKTSWKEEYIGPTAVSLGIKYMKPIHTQAGQHYCRKLRNCAIFYAPIYINHSEHDKTLCGGVAIIGPAGDEHKDYLIVASAVARHIALQIIWIESLNLLAIDGFLYVDRSTGKYKILFINQGVFEMMNIPYKDYTFQELNELVDEEQNPFFWDALKNRKTFWDTETVLYVAGKPRSVNVSITHLTVVNHHIDGACLVFNSRKRINNIISALGINDLFTFDRIIGKNKHFVEAIEHAKAASKYPSNLLLLGESGVGKDIIAQSIHNESPRRSAPFIAINCAALPRELISSELFGYEAGTFTGGKPGGKLGKFELANHGTIFLDEIGDMPLDLQATLLRIIEEKSFMRVGGSQLTKVDVRIIAASNRDILEMVHRNEFRSDLYFRISTIKIKIPPLRQRRDDILLLSDFFIGKVATWVGKVPPQLTAEAKQCLCTYDWPGNIRELQNLFEGIIQIFDGSSITEEQIRFYLDDFRMTHKIPINPSNTVEETPPAGPEGERELYRRALERNRHHRGNTAKYLRISRKTLYRKLKKYELE
jgi:transcriptional regulator with PAS, ATPase and Fis domain